MTHFETVDDNTKYIQIDKIEVYRDFIVQDASSLTFEYILEYLKILTSTSIFRIVLDSYNSELELENTDMRDHLLGGYFLLLGDNESRFLSAYKSID